MSCVATYNPGDVTISLALLYEALGFAPDSIITINKDEQQYTTQKGSTGSVERTHISDRTYTMEITLAQTSSTNQVLNALSTVDHYSKSGIFPIFAKDNSGQSLFLAPSCWIEEEPEASYTNTIETRTWKIRCGEMNFGLAGNSDSEDFAEKLSRYGSFLGQIGGSANLF